MNIPNQIVLEWKFEDLDKNRDHLLRRKELRQLLRAIRKLVKPKACAKKFHELCDVNKDSKISPTEWLVCLGVIKSEYSEYQKCPAIR